jgi:hypothetical protein
MAGYIANVCVQGIYWYTHVSEDFQVISLVVTVLMQIDR